MTRDRAGLAPEATLFLVVIVSAAVVLLVTSTDACHTPIVVVALTREPHAAASCLEFWLYRYQGLLGGLFTLAAAGIAWFGLQKQIRVGRVGELRRSLANLRDVRGKLNDCASGLIRLLDVERQVSAQGAMTLASAQADALARLVELGRLNGVRSEVKAIRREELFDDDLEALLTAVNETMKGAGRLARETCMEIAALSDGEASDTGSIVAKLDARRDAALRLRNDIVADRQKLKLIVDALSADLAAEIRRRSV